MVRRVSGAARAAMHTLQPAAKNPGITAIRGYALKAFKLAVGEPSPIHTASKNPPTSKQARKESQDVSKVAARAFHWKKV